ncbi:MAG: glucosamine-6-phosphate deaminase [Spirochaetales bacterium]|nr:glucosamine-6-phosphate deaminase [Candidatus Physcosoma equi]
MNVIVCKNKEEMAKKGAAIIASLLVSKPNCVLGLATGSTPVGMYKELIEKNQKGEISFRDVTTVNLDEYYPIAPTNDQSYRYFMNDNLFNHVDVDMARTHVLNGLAEDPEKECADYDKMIEELGGIDLQVLGIGRNGHIAFNEPDATLVSGTHKTGLTPSTIEANSRFFASSDDVPRFALTMGIGSIMKASSIIILASGPDKKEAVCRMLSGVIDPMCPATILSCHKNVTVLCTEDTIA